jgi:hypothetical protein
MKPLNQQKKLKRELIIVNDFLQCDKIKKKPHVKTKLAIYCNACGRPHHLHFGEFKNALVEAKCLQDIIQTRRKTPSFRSEI